MAMHLLASEIVALTADCHGLSCICARPELIPGLKISHMLGMPSHW